MEQNDRKSLSTTENATQNLQQRRGDTNHKVTSSFYKNPRKGWTTYGRGGMTRVPLKNESASC